MRSLAATGATVLLALAAAGCGGDGAEPGASREATLVLDFQPNAVHAGLYAALRRGYFEDEGLELEVREPSASTDAPKLLEAGRAELAILDINDLGIALERGLELEPIAAIVQRPLAAVIAADREAVSRPRDLEGGTVGVTGLPSDDAVLDAVLEADDADPDTVRRVTIGFDSVAALRGGRVDAATAFWNAEGVALERIGVRTREFRVDQYGAQPYPELVLVTASASGDGAELAPDVVDAVERAYRSLGDDPGAALDDLLAEGRGLERPEQEAQLDALIDADAFSPPHSDEPSTALEPTALESWLRFAAAHGIIDDAERIRPALLDAAKRLSD